MIQDVVLVIRLLFGPIWSLFTSWHIPGTLITPAEFAFFSLSFVFAIRIFKFFILGRNSNDNGGR